MTLSTESLSGVKEDVFTTIDKDLFIKKITVIALQVQPKTCHKVLSLVKPYTIRKTGIRNIVADPGDETGKGRLVLLNEETIKTRDDVESCLPSDIVEAIKREEIRVVEHEISLSYDNMSQESIMRKLLPVSIGEIPSAFETVGHIAHFNLRDELLPYKHIIGQVILDKNAHIKTVVTKLGNIETKFRTFPMEVIAGKQEFDVRVKEHNVTFEFNFADVYWNSRLQEEHRIIVSRFRKNEVIADAMCGIGPFAVPAAIKGCNVYANDLNPKCYKYLLRNVEKNKVTSKVSCFNTDARDFIRLACKGDFPSKIEGQKEKTVFPQHIVMNLPAAALSFLDVFPGCFDRNLWQNKPLPMVHCHCFSSGKTQEERRDNVISRAENYLGCSLKPNDKNEVEVRYVRDVAPNKFMMCLHFRVPEQVAFAFEDPEGEGEAEGEKTTPDPKRPKVEFIENSP
eukprot:CAMPEP_0204838266 /NCGR_PEP_ID=MMETSP1346-20131115/30358_1 /ASSEMBLY_ACC=CAM_ASM_000771 /TAXON_ID=215587 /ORGANISM="Aplanochytrium stocchinoi, Strain GSBS06" /LENGTH=453 /DNA_ID=CAMNT_0051974183 /DNA_START=415 /DNA_END=1776 /DNA_ORIENTATION=-